MKRLLLILLFVVITSQCFGQVYQKMSTWYQWQRTVNDSSLGLPKDTFRVIQAFKNSPHIAAKGDSIYVWSVSAQKWILNGVQNQYISKQTANSWIDTLKLSRLNITDRLTASMSGQSHIYLPFSAANGRGNVGIHISNKPLWSADDPNYSAYASPVNLQNSGSMHGISRYWSVLAGDSNRIDYSPNYQSFFRYTFDGTTFDSSGTKYFYPGDPGVNANVQYYVGGGRNVRFAVSQFGQQGAALVGTMSFFTTGGGTVNIVSQHQAVDRGYAMSAIFADLDFNRAAGANDKKVVRGFVTGVFASWKTFQSGTGNPSLGIGNSVDSVADYAAGGAPKYANFSTVLTKAEILSHSRVGRDIGVYIYPRYGRYNDVENGYGVVQKGIYDINQWSGKTFHITNSNFVDKTAFDTTSARVITKGRTWTDSLSTSYITVASLPAGSSDYDKFLVSDGGEIKTRTGTQIASDIGAVPYTGATTTVDLGSQNLTTTGTVSSGVVAASTGFNITNGGDNISLRRSGSGSQVVYLPLNGTDQNVAYQSYVDGKISEAPQSLTDGATITWNMSSGRNATVTLGGNRTLSISNATAGMFGTLKIIQDGTGSRTITLPAGSKVISGGLGAVALSTTAAAVDLLSFYYDGTNYFWTIGKNYN